MKIYIDWDKREWYGNKDDIIKSLVYDDLLPSLSSWLAEEYEGCLEELLEFSESQKKEVKNNYRQDVEMEFENNIANGYCDNITILEIDTEKDYNIREI